MKTRIVQIGNSRGIRLPKVLLEEAQLADEVELQAERRRIVIRAAGRPRAGWAAAARRMRERGEGRLLDPLTSTRLDEEDCGQDYARLLLFAFSASGTKERQNKITKG